MSCTDHACELRTSHDGVVGTVGTNGGCSCMLDLPPGLRREIRLVLQALRARLAAAESERDEAYRQRNETEQALLDERDCDYAGDNDEVCGSCLACYKRIAAGRLDDLNEVEADLAASREECERLTNELRLAWEPHTRECAMMQEAGAPCDCGAPLLRAVVEHTVDSYHDLHDECPCCSNQEGCPVAALDALDAKGGG